jgi:hypothetical protein
MLLFHIHKLFDDGLVLLHEVRPKDFMQEAPGLVLGRQNGKELFQEDSSGRIIWSWSGGPWKYGRKNPPALLAARR